jgi:hypothetical protein
MTMKIRALKFLCAIAALGSLGLAPAFAAVPFPTKATPAAHDIGAAEDFLGAKPMTVTLALKLKESLVPRRGCKRSTRRAARIS